jgi:hypothetical protein
MLKEHTFQMRQVLRATNLGGVNTFLSRWRYINPVRTKRNLLYLKVQFVPRSKHSAVIKTNWHCHIGHKSLFVLRSMRDM